MTSQFSCSKCPCACLRPPICSCIGCTNLRRNSYSPHSSHYTTVLQHSFIFLLDPLFGNQLATNSLKYSPSFHFLSYAPGEQQAPQAWNRWEIWSIMHRPGLSPAHPLVRWFHPSGEVPEPVFRCVPSALVATGSSLQPQVIQPVDQVLVRAVGNRL